MIQKKNQKIDFAAPGADLYPQALELALRKLRSKDRFEAEIRQFLGEFPIDTVEQVIRFLKERRIIDDRKTILNLIESYSGKRSVGLEKLRAELLERGAPEETVNTALCISSDEERERMVQALSVKFSPEGQERAKAARFLFSRGFSEDDIESVLERFFQA